MNIIGVIPARYQSSRLVGKPLADIGGKIMIQRVYEQAKKANCLQEVYVATDDQRIFDEVKNFGGEVVMTAESHKSGTDRCGEVAQILQKKQAIDVIINIQGDEPFINPNQINEVGKLFKQETTQIATLVKVIDNQEELTNVNIPKVVLAATGKAVYFSRQTIPFLRNYPIEQWLTQHTFYKHIGIYGYRTNILAQLVQLPIATLEKMECLEQLRWLANDFEIQTAVTTYATIAVDTPKDLALARQLITTQ